MPESDAEGLPAGKESWFMGFEGTDARLDDAVRNGLHDGIGRVEFVGRLEGRPIDCANAGNAVHENAIVQGHQELRRGVQVHVGTNVSLGRLDSDCGER